MLLRRRLAADLSRSNASLRCATSFDSLDTFLPDPRRLVSYPCRNLEAISVMSSAEYGADRNASIGGLLAVEATIGPTLARTAVVCGPTRKRQRRYEAYKMAPDAMSLAWHKRGARVQRSPQVTRTKRGTPTPRLAFRWR